MSIDMTATRTAFQETARILGEHEQFPFGPPITDGQVEQMAGAACVRLCNEDPDKARTLWRLIVTDCGGYMPVAAGRALIRAAATANLVPDITPPEAS